MKTEVERTMEFAENMKQQGKKEREAEIIEQLEDITKGVWGSWRQGTIRELIKQIKEEKAK